ANAVSSYVASVKPTENVASLCDGATLAAAATTALESRPPLRNTPTGTSATSRRPTDVHSAFHVRAAHSPSSHRAAWEKDMPQYRLRHVLPPDTVSRCPGASLLTPRTMAWGSAT